MRVHKQVQPVSSVVVNGQIFQRYFAVSVLKVWLNYRCYQPVFCFLSRCSLLVYLYL